MLWSGKVLKAEVVSAFTQTVLPQAAPYTAHMFLSEMTIPKAGQEVKSHKIECSPNLTNELIIEINSLAI